MDYKYRAMKKKIKLFLEEKCCPNHRWLEVAETSLYMRRSVYSSAWSEKYGIWKIEALSQQDKIRILDFATIEVREKDRRKGIFKRLLRLTEQYARKYGYKAVIIEQLRNEIVVPYIIQEGYRKLETEEAISYIKPII